MNHRRQRTLAYPETIDACLRIDVERAVRAVRRILLCTVGAVPYEGVVVTCDGRYAHSNSARDVGDGRALALYEVTLDNDLVFENRLTDSA